MSSSLSSKIDSIRKERKSSLFSVLEEFKKRSKQSQLKIEECNFLFGFCDL